MKMIIAYIVMLVTCFVQFMPSALVQCVPLSDGKRFKSTIQHQPVLGNLMNDIIRSPNKEGEVDLVSRAVLNERRWPNALIPFELDSSYTDSERTVIANGMNEYHKNTCIRFVPRTTEKDYLSITKENGCASFVGRIGGVQPLYLADGCIFQGAVLHELMHAVGFEHEHQRYDRDNYLYVNSDNIEADWKDFYNKESPEGQQLFNTPYDTQSISHYNDAFRIDPNTPVLYSYDGSNIGTKDIFTATDLLDLNRLYNCDANDCWNSTTCNSGQGPLIWQMADLGHFVYANNCDFSGSDIKSSIADSNTICRELCMANISCTHITWNMVTKMCYLKKGPKAHPLSLQAYYVKGAVCGYVNHRLP